MTSIPQYAKTQRPEVLEAIEANMQRAIDFHEKACAFAIKHGVEDGDYYRDAFAGHVGIGAVGGKEKPTTGQWTKHRRGGWRPYANSPVAEEMGALSFRKKQVPGVPSLVYSAMNRSMQQRASSPSPFVVDGVAYVGFGFVPADDQPEMRHAGDGGWEEIKASEFHKALETYNEARKA